MKKISKNNVQSQAKLVSYSRAGDAFHYRWAARRCLKLIHPNAELKSITVEGTKEPKNDGECGIDLAEYYVSAQGTKSVHYFQLKHSTVRLNKAFTFAELKKVLADFAQRQTSLLNEKSPHFHVSRIHFSLVTNRPVSQSLKNALTRAAVGDFKKVSKVNIAKLLRATKLTQKTLPAFCAALTISDGEGDYLVQKRSLRGEMHDYIAGFIDNQEVDKLINIVSERALPQAAASSDGNSITSEDVLKAMGVTSQRGLFPAPPEFEKLPKVIRREQHDEIVQDIVSSQSPRVIHAEGGVGKSIVARQIAQSIKNGSEVFIYDCFGAGKYRSQSEPRHRISDALVQLANEMCAAGLCAPFVGHAGMPPDALFSGFVSRVKQAVKLIKQRNAKSILVLIIDAADNSEMAAVEFGDRCFAKLLLREPLPDGCKTVYLCRTERVYLLNPPSSVKQIPLKPFSLDETRTYLRSFYPSATDVDILEFHRRTGGNPRVQANAVMFGAKGIDAILANLSPSMMTVEMQISIQLQTAVSKIKDENLKKFADQIDAICTGLANLPPFIPLSVLANVAEVEVASIKSFVSDLGRPLWHSDDSVQFRDEPTETWFRKTFAASPSKIRKYVSRLKPFAQNSAYVARALPQLLLAAENYTGLIELALSNGSLPTNNAIDERNIRVYRLQFAFKAALKMGRIADALQLAMRAGEEVAGDKRQMDLLAANSDLIPILQGAHQVQDLVYRRKLKGSWLGSENVYAASLLSSVKDFQGEARSYLRAAFKWLQIYFEDRTKSTRVPEHPHHPEKLKGRDIAELAWSLRSLHGIQSAGNYLLRWKPPEFLFGAVRDITKRLIDCEKYDEVDKLAKVGSKNVSFIIAITQELAAVGRFLSASTLRFSLNSLLKKKSRIEKPSNHSFNDSVTPAIISLLEACAVRKLPRINILKVLDYYVEQKPDHFICSDYQDSRRFTRLRGIALRLVLQGKQDFVINDFLPIRKETEARAKNEEERRETNIKEVVQALLPWHHLRARLLVADPDASRIDLEAVKHRSKSAFANRHDVQDRLKYEVSKARFDSMMVKRNLTKLEVGNFIKSVLEKAGRKWILKDRLEALYACMRISHLAPLRTPLEENCSAVVEAPGTDSPDDRAGWYLELARAVLATNQPDSAAYFAKAIDAVSKFGDEMVERWEAVVAVAKRTEKDNRRNAKLCYRFFRVAEIIGETVAREKYWNRNEAIQVGMGLHTPQAFAALSRWRDRKVGWIDSELYALVKAAVDQSKLGGSLAWGFSGFEGCNGSGNYALSCVKRMESQELKRLVLDTALRDLDLSEAKPENLGELSGVFATTKLDRTRFDEMMRIATTSSKGDSPVSPPPGQLNVEMKYHDKKSWAKIFNGRDLLKHKEIGLARIAFHKSKRIGGSDDFWNELIKRIPMGSEINFLRLLTEADLMNHYEFASVLSVLKKDWLKKAAVKMEWPLFLERIGKYFSTQLSAEYSFGYFLRTLQLNEQEISLVQKGMNEGLADSVEMADASTFFGFVRGNSNKLNTSEAVRLLDFSLARFELHLPLDYGDGNWDSWLETPSSALESATGFIWSALGSPFSSTRWEAAHCVRRICETSDGKELDLLIKWMKRGSVGAFGSRKFPFYSLHARQYLLIAISRVAKDNAKLFSKHAKVFSKIALSGLPHILIQKIAADICFSIEKGKARTYSKDVLKRLNSVGISQLPPRNIASYKEASVNSPWHQSTVPKGRRPPRFSYDFDRYWFESLSHIFGIPKEQVIDLARDVAIEKLGVSASEEYIKDPRQELWNSLQQQNGQRTTWHDHGLYPAVDDYDFYFSYHSLMSVTAKLLGKVPVIHQRHQFYDEDRWLDWLSRHFLTRPDGKWLADRRDAIPISRRQTFINLSSQSQKFAIEGMDFLKALKDFNTLPNTLCIMGRWEGADSSISEIVRIASAFVNPETSSALANALRNSEDPQFYLLPNAGDKDNEYYQKPYELTGWLFSEHDESTRLDRFDPYAAEIDYPSPQFGEEIVRKLNLVSDSERRLWGVRDLKNPVVDCAIWSDKKLNDRDWGHRSGKRMCASVPFLKYVCQTFRRDLIFEVIIERSPNRRSGDSEDPRYIIPSHKIFVLTKEGLLNDGRTNHQIG